MSKRAHLYDLTRQLGRYLRWQQDCGTESYLPAGEEVRQILQAKKEAAQKRQVEALKAGFDDGDANERGADKRSADKRSANKRGGSSSQDGKGQKAAPDGPPAPGSAKTAKDEQSAASEDQSAQGITASTPLWKKHRAIHELDREKRQKAEEANQKRRQAQGASASKIPAKPENPETPAEKLAFLHHYLGNCKRCPLCENREHVVFGEGNPQARLVFVGEGPGRQEDLEGRPFVGPSGQLLTKMIGAMGLSRDEVYITNIVKCRPPQNRNPAPLEIKECAPFLKKQLEVLEPEVIVTVGRFASNMLLESDEALSKLRGRWHDYQGISVMPTYHPAYLLRNEDDRRLRGKAWSDLQMVMDKLGLTKD